ncbi:MAG: hypothetical protein ACR2PX_22455 [Endozoicomonas sp.]|uniref:hypothetical protein n=1 Tax=Endozoicomonas sp. TaxID=1892382 RepID=UPI003D9B9C61
MKFKKLKTLIFIPLVIIHVSPNLYGYEPYQHQLISNSSINLYNKCQKTLESVGTISSDESEQIINANSGEDTSISKAPYRIFNWHFYNSSKESGQEYFPINRSMTGLLHSIENTLKASYEFDPVATGSGLHFIEDVTVPAHVMPVFHGPLAPLIMGGAVGRYDFGLIHDEIDKWEIDVEELESFTDTLSESINNCERLFRAEINIISVSGKTTEIEYDINESPLLYFVDHTSKQTEISYKKLIPGCDISWEWFWNFDYGHDYFNGYRSEWDESMPVSFGDERQISDDCTMTNNNYNSFVFQRHLQAIVSGAAFIAHLKSKGSL